MRPTFVLTSIVAVLMPLIASAGPIIRSGESVTVDADQVLEGDFYGAGNNVLLSGVSEHDVYVAGGSVTVNAEVKEDLVALGGSVQVHAPVNDDVRALGGEVVIADHVAGDVVVLAGSLNILSTAVIDGDVLFFGGKADIGGDVKGSVVGTAENVRIDAHVGGNVTVTADRLLTLGDRAELLGNLEYTSRADVARQQSAVVVGDIHKNAVREANGVSAYTVILPVLMVLFAALTAYLLFKPRLEELVRSTERSYGMQGLVGLGMFLGIPFAAVVLTASVLGSIVGVVLLLAYVILLLASWLSAGIVLGTLLLKPITKSTSLNLISVIIGVVVFSLLFLIPYIGVLLVLVALLITMGGIGMQLYRTFR